jgi:hypothetical protein
MLRGLRSILKSAATLINLQIRAIVSIVAIVLLMVGNRMRFTRFDHTLDPGLELNCGRDLAEKYLKSYNGKSYNYEITFQQEPTIENVKSAMQITTLYKLTFLQYLFDDFERILKSNAIEEKSRKIFVVNKEEKFNVVGGNTSSKIKSVDLSIMEGCDMYYEIAVYDPVNLMVLFECIKKETTADEQAFDGCLVIEDDNTASIKLYIGEGRIDKFIDMFCISTGKYISRRCIYDQDKTSGGTTLSGFQWQE